MKNKIEGNQAKIQDEKALAVLMQTGTDTQKQNAFNQLYKASKEALFYKILLKRFRLGKEEARDAMQEIFMKVFKYINTYNTDYAFSTWLYKIAYNHVVDMKRQHNYEMLNIEVLQVNGSESEDAGGASMVFQLEDKSANNYELLVRQERAEMVQLAIKEAIKSKETKLLLHKAFMEDKPYEQISQEMKLPIGTIKTLIFRAKETLKEHLSKKSVDFEYGRVCTTKLKTVREVENS